MKNRIYLNWLLLLLTAGFAFFVFGAPVQASGAFDESVPLVRSGRYLESETLTFDAAINAVALQASAPGGEWSILFGDTKWQPFEVHDDGFGPDALVFTSSATSVKIRRAAQLFERSDTIHLQPLYADTTNSLSAAQLGRLTAGPGDPSGFRVISRSEWGADETLRYWRPEYEQRIKNIPSSSDENAADPCGDFSTKYASEVAIRRTVNTGPGGESLIWPLSYSDKIRKFVVHHTDSEIRDLNGDARMDSRDYEAIVRAIYQFHAYSRAWGDIGYNYIIDPLGNIYEGRFGGDSVVGAHTACYNNGAMGIAIIGNYEDNNVPEPAMDALIQLIALKAKQHGVDPEASASFRGKVISNIVGHKDLRATSCPGKVLYAQLPRIRERSGLLSRLANFTDNNVSVQAFDYDAAFAAGAPPTISVAAGERKTLSLQFRNTGKQTWDNSTWLHVALNKDAGTRLVPLIRDKIFVAADMKESSVPPGGTATFEVEVEGGYEAGRKAYEVAVVANGKFKISRASVFVPVQVSSPNFSYEVVRSELPPSSMYQGQRISAWVELKNTGNVVWKNYGANPITLGADGPRDRKSPFIQKNPARVGYLLQSEVAPGQIGRFVMELDGPLDITGSVTERFTPVIEGVRWLDDRGLSFTTDLRPPRHATTITKLNDLASLLPGERKELKFTMVNQGDITWEPGQMTIGINGYGIRVFDRQLGITSAIAPGQSKEFSFWIEAPYRGGNHSLALNAMFNRVPIQGGLVRYSTDVQNPSLRGGLAEKIPTTIQLRPNEEMAVTVKFKNLGNTVWQKKGNNAVNLAPSLPRDRLSRLSYEGAWVNKFRAAAMNEDTVKPGETASFTFKVRPAQAGFYREPFQLVMEQVGWIDGAIARLNFRVSGESVSASSASTTSPTLSVTVTDGSKERVIDELADARANKQKAAQLVRAQATQAPTTSTSTPQPSTPAVSPTAPSVQTSSVSAPTRPIRVRLSYNADESRVGYSQNYRITDGSGEVLFTVAAGESATLRRSGGNIHVQVGNITRAASVIRVEGIPTNGRFVIHTWENRPAWNPALNDNEFRGALEVREVNGQAAYINELSLEDYMRGIAEVPNDTPREKAKALSVLARTYARFYMEEANRKFPGLPYDGSDDPDVFQKYLGYGYEKRSPNFLQALDATIGQIVTYQGKLIKTPYFSQSDGRTRSAKEVWGWADTPYLQSVEDPYCKGLTMKGHGVGLSGCGSDGMARNGASYQDIIKYYYQGVAINTMK